MAASKKFDPSKLTLGVKKEIKKEALEKTVHNHVDAAVEQIHNPKPDSNVEKLETEQSKQVVQESTKRTTVDIPEGLHKQIKRRLIDKELTIKDYILDLVKKDMGLQ